jgi:8-oxo-dGTP pyrophosphatase MutT (NUDIX family)
MPRSPYVRALRNKIGNDLLMLPAVAIMLFDERRRLLLAQQVEGGLWMTIGGAVEPDESPAHAALRECWEETGLRIEITGVVGVFGGPEFRINYPNGDTVSYVVTAFEARRLAGEPRPDGLEASSLRFVSRADAQELPMAGWTQEMVKRAYDYQQTAYFAQPIWGPLSEP